MTFVPGQQRPMGTPAMFRTVLFWVLMIALAIVLWQMQSSKRNTPAASQISYSDFIGQVDNSNVSAVHLYESPSTAEIRGRLRQPPNAFRVTIPKESIPDITERLRKQGATIQVSGRGNASWTTLLINLSPFILVLAIWIYMMRRQVQKPQGLPPANAANRPIG